MTSNPQSEIRQDADLGSGTLSTKDIVFFVLAGVAPMGVVVGILSLSIALGNGPGVPGTYLIAGAVLALFAIGYVRMSQRVTSTGGFYTFAKEGLGTAASGATAYLAVIAYNAAAIGIFGSLAFFSGTVMSSVFGINLAWGWWALLWGAVVAILAYFEISASYCQDLWMGEFQAASSESELGSGSTSLPFSKVAPSRTSFTRCGALTARHFDWAASINL